MIPPNRYHDVNVKIWVRYNTPSYQCGVADCLDDSNGQWFNLLCMDSEHKCKESEVYVNQVVVEPPSIITRQNCTELGSETCQPGYDILVVDDKNVAQFICRSNGLFDNKCVVAELTKGSTEGKKKSGNPSTSVASVTSTHSGCVSMVTAYLTAAILVFF